VIEPIFEREFAPRNYGFRPGRGCTDALWQVTRLLKEGYVWVVDADLKGYFDSIPHDRLMEEVRKRIADGRVLELIEGYLKQDVLEENKLWTPEKGSPQGAVVSPLLSNLYLHSVDVAVAEAGYEMIRYADDFVILCRTRKEAERALELTRTLTGERGLELHPTKTRLVNVEEEGEGFDFLGYHFRKDKYWPRKKSLEKLKDTIRRKTKRSNGQSLDDKYWPRKKSLEKLKDTIRRKTKRSNGQSLDAIVKDVNRTLIGWFGYFKYSYPTTFPYVDGWIQRRLRSILRKRKKLRGVSKGGLDHQRWPNAFFRDAGLFCLKAAHASYCQSRRGTH